MSERKVEIDYTNAGFIAWRKVFPATDDQFDWDMYQKCKRGELHFGADSGPPSINLGEPLSEYIARAWKEAKALGFEEGLTVGDLSVITARKGDSKEPDTDSGLSVGDLSIINRKKKKRD